MHTKPLRGKLAATEQVVQQAGAQLAHIVFQRVHIYQPVYRYVYIYIRICVHTYLHVYVYRFSAYIYIYR